MGVLNLTPDSFSGDGLAGPDLSVNEVVAAAVAQAERFVAAGATMLDVGAESSRPAHSYGDHPPVSAEREMELVLPAISELRGRFGDRVVLSVDTTKGSVARAAAAAGAGMINDVWAGRRDPDTLRAAAESGTYLVVMHNREVPEYPRGVLNEVIAELVDATERAAEAGVAADRVIVDPGIGFGKTPDQSLELLHRLADLREALGFPLLVGTSRKRFIGEILGGVPPEERVEGTAASVALAIAAGTDIVRVHDVEHIARTVAVADAIVRRSLAPAPVGSAISLTGLEARGHHGVGDDERRNPQPFEVDLTVESAHAAFGAGDDLGATVNYAELQALAVSVVENESHALIETIARRIAAAVLERWPAVDRVEVRVRKTRPPLPAPGIPEATIRLRRGVESA
jgi:dihydropteroate synthase